MCIDIRIEPLSGPLPSVAWRRDDETEILSGGFKNTRKGGGLTGAIELTDSDGSIAVLDVSHGVICGIDIVVWPEVTVAAGLRIPDSPSAGRGVMVGGTGRPEIASIEIDIALVMRVDPTETLYHLQVGPPRPVKVVQIASLWYLDIDVSGRLAGFWFAGVPQLTAFDDV